MTLFVLLAACADPASDALVGRLESFSAMDDAPDDWEARTFDGEAAVTGGDRDWQVAIDLIDGTTETVDIHVPGASDLAFLDGAALSVALGDGWGSNPRDLVVDDDEGTAFLAQIREGGVSEDTFGEGFAAYGEARSTSTLTDDYGDYGVEDRSVVFATDGGEVEAEVGVPIEADVGGARWRIVVHAAFVVTEYPDTMPGCGGGISDTMSFEMARVAAEPALDTLSPLDGAALAGEYSCE